MKTLGKIIGLFILVAICNPSFGQTEEQKKMPPMEMLPKKGKSKTIYQLPESCSYQVFNSKGKLYDEGEGEWIDMGKYKKDTYFIRYNDETISYEHKD